MASAKKGPLVVHMQLADAQRVRLCLTLRDPFGSPIPKMTMTVQQSGVELKTPGGGALATDDDGRVDIEGVVPGVPLKLKLDERYVPPDAEDRRKTHYVYTIESKSDIAIETIIKDDDHQLTMVDRDRAYTTVFASVQPYYPVFRFPWQNPLHREPGGFYEKRVANLRWVLQSLFGSKEADVNALEHNELVARLIELFEKSMAPPAVAAPPPESPAPEPPVAEIAPEPAPPSEPPPPPPPAPAEPAPDVVTAQRQIPIQDETPEPTVPEAPPPAPPANMPSANTDSKELPRWVWYLLFHHTGLRYSPPHPTDPKGKTVHGAHGCYVKPAWFLARLREQELEAWFGGKAGPPANVDVTEALALIQCGKAAKKHEGALLSGDAKKMNAALAEIFTSLKDAEVKRLDTFRTDDKLLDGDYVALGLLKAKRLNKHPVLTDELWKQIVSRTQLRNDVQAAGWEEVRQTAEMAVLRDFFPKKQGKEEPRLNGTWWRNRRQQTLDTLLSSAVCDQTAETGELIRSGHVGEAIPGNARVPASLRCLGADSVKEIRRGMHLFFSVYGDVRPGEQDYVVETKQYIPQSIWIYDPDPPTAPAPAPKKLVPFAEIQEITDLNEILDRAKSNKEALVVLPEKVFAGLRKVSAELLPNCAKGKAFVRCVEDKKKGVTTLHVLKWQHQEMVIDVRTVGRDTRIFTFTTRGGESGLDTGVLKCRDFTSNHSHIYFGMMYDTPKENTALLDACFLNPALLKG